MASSNLIERVHALPAELFNQIRDEVFTPKPCTVRIDAKYKPPSSLQVDKASRRRYTLKYYGGVVKFTCANPDLLLRYLASLTKAQRRFLHSISLITAPTVAVDSNARTRFRGWKRYHSHQHRTATDIDVLRMLGWRCRSHVLNEAKARKIAVREDMIELVCDSGENSGESEFVREMTGLEKHCQMLGKDLQKFPISWYVLVLNACTLKFTQIPTTIRFR